MTFSSVPPMDGDEVTMLNEFEYYQLPSSKYQPEKFVGIVVRKQADFVLMYIPDPRFNCGELCVLLRKHANVRSLAEFNEKFTLGEFYDISVVRVTEPTVFGPRSIELMCTTDEIQLTKSDWKFTYSRVILGGFVQVKVICDFTDDNLEDLRDISGDCCCVYTDFGKVLVEKAFIVEQNLYETSVNWWVTFVKETKGCHWQLFETDNPEAISECYDQQQMQKSDNALSDDQHSETISVPSPTMGRRELDGAQSMDDEGEQQQNDYDNRLRFCGAPVPLDRTVLAFLLERAKATLLNDEQLSRELARTQTLLRASERECEQLRCEVQRFKLQLSS